jgi:uncharacterized protein (UPF0333 family)
VVVIISLISIGLFVRFSGMTIGIVEKDSAAYWSSLIILFSSFFGMIHNTFILSVGSTINGILRKGQASIEYLIILAVVVIIALIVIGVIGGFPGMTRGLSERDSASYWTSADIGIVRYYINSSNDSVSSQFVIRNNRLFTINLTNITFDTGSYVSGLLNYSAIATGYIIAPASTAQVYLNMTAPTSTAGICTKGSTYPKTVTITYKDSTYGTTYTFVGEKPLVGTCQ